MLNTEYVQELMNEKGWTLGMLSMKSGISKAQLSRLMSEKRGAGQKTMAGLIRAFPDADIGKLFLLHVLPIGNTCSKRIQKEIEHIISGMLDLAEEIG